MWNKEVKVRNVPYSAPGVSEYIGGRGRMSPQVILHSTAAPPSLEASLSLRASHHTHDGQHCVQEGIGRAITRLTD